MKAICRACGHQAHNLKPHFQEGACPLTLKEYVDRYPGERLTSELFDRELLKLQDEKKSEADKPAVANDTLTPKTFSAKSLFGTDLGKLDEVSGFLERSPLVPDIDPDYIFPDEATKIVLIGLITNRPTLGPRSHRHRQIVADRAGLRPVELPGDEGQSSCGYVHL